MRTQLPVPLIYPVLYAVVLVAGLYVGAIGVRGTSVVPFVGALLALAAIDPLEWRAFPAGASMPMAVGLLALRAALYAVVVVADPSGIARVLLLFLPFRVYFLFGRVAALAVGALLVGLMLTWLQLADPGWASNTEQITDLVMFVVGLVLTLAVAAVAAEERLGRERLRLASAAAERSRVGREIHDGLGHHLTAISVLLEKAVAFRGIDPTVADAAIADAQESSRLALHDVRRSVRTLSEGEPFDLVDALGALTRGLPVSLSVSGDVAGYDDATRLVIYRAAQEGVTNALRHASATTIDVDLELGTRDAAVTVSDDGCGFAPTRIGWGLTGMRERVEDAGGTLDIASTAGHGTRLAVRVPRVAR